MRLVVDSISLSFGDAVILRDISCELDSGTVVSLVGPNGSGKTTLLNIVTGLTAPTSGEVRFGGNVLSGKSPEVIARLGIARTFQDQHIAWNATCLENVLGALDFTSPKKQIADALSPESGKQRIVLDLLKAFELGGLEDIPARDLSFGQQRLLALAQVFATGSRILLLDEPFTGLKSQARNAVLSQIDQHRSYGGSVIVVDHNLSTMKEMGGEVWYLNRGSLRKFLSMKDVISSDSFIQDYVGLHTGTSSEKHVGKLDASNYDSIEPPAPSEQLPEHDDSAVSSSSVTRENDPKQLLVHALSAGYNRHLVVDRVSFDVSRGETICILGANGCGKSTLLRALAGLLPMRNGSITLDEKDISVMPAHIRVRRGLRTLPQENRIFESLSYQENRELSISGFSAQIHSRSTLRAPIELNNLDLESLNHIRPELDAQNSRPTVTLSGGEQARIALEQLTYGPIIVMLMDEPTSGIDGIGKQLLGSLIKAWNNRGISIVMVEHDLEFASSVAAGYLVMRNGTLSERRRFQGNWREELISALSLK